jgi:hypothetical protein
MKIDRIKNKKAIINLITHEIDELYPVVSFGAIDNQILILDEIEID